MHVDQERDPLTAELDDTDHHYYFYVSALLSPVAQLSFHLDDFF